MLAEYHGILNMQKITCQKELRVSYVSNVPEVNDLTLREIRTSEQLVFEPNVLSLSCSLKSCERCTLPGIDYSLAQLIHS